MQGAVTNPLSSSAPVSLREELPVAGAELNSREELAKLQGDVQKLRLKAAIKLETEALNRERDELQLLLSEENVGVEWWKEWKTKRELALESAALTVKDLHVKRAEMRARNKLYEELVELADFGAQKAREGEKCKNWRWPDPCYLCREKCAPLKSRSGRLCRGKCKKTVDLFSASPRDFESTAVSADTTVNTLTLVSVARARTRQNQQNKPLQQQLRILTPNRAAATPPPQPPH